ncbi:hypothetical protein PSCICF_39760 [Pseudomonas cichorii]|nr:hypothetical protein PSCICF_39760 [Pseudomonas cichorii]GFM62531.1 hypothetical protein PSCICG_36910 [Pseudomonas cichorii]
MKDPHYGSTVAVVCAANEHVRHVFYTKVNRVIAGAMTLDDQAIFMRLRRVSRVARLSTPVSIR